MRKVTNKNYKSSCCSDIKTAQCCAKSSKVVEGCHD